jgi:hypothetical protein
MQSHTPLVAELVFSAWAPNVKIVDMPEPVLYLGERVGDPLCVARKMTSPFGSW